MGSARLVALIVALGSVLSVTAPEAWPASAASAAPVVGRATTDRPDDLSAPQVHVVYAIPADGVDRRLDVDGSLVNSVGSFQRWLRGQTPGRALRMDTYQGQLDVTFFRSAMDGEDVVKDNALAGTLGEELVQAGFAAKHKRYAVYWDGPSVPLPCGGAQPGRPAVMYLQSSCAQPLASSPRAPMGYWEAAMLHDVFHTLGVVADCAPRHNDDRPLHVGGDPTDLMWAGRGDWLPTGFRSAVLDVGHDDYYRHGVRGCADLDDSPFLTSTVEPRRHDVSLTPARLTAGAATTATVHFGHGFSSVDSACVDVLVDGDPPGPDTITLTIDPALPTLAASVPPPTTAPAPRPVSWCLDGQDQAAFRAVFADGQQSVSLTIGNGSVRVVSVTVHVLGVAQAAAAHPPVQVFTRTATLSPVRLAEGQTASGVVNLGPRRFSLLDDVCFTIDFADDQFDNGEQITIELAGTGAPPLPAGNVASSVASRRRCVTVDREPLAFAAIATGGPLAVSVSAAAGSVAISGLRLDLIASTDPA